MRILSVNFLIIQNFGKNFKEFHTNFEKISGHYRNIFRKFAGNFEECWKIMEVVEGIGDIKSNLLENSDKFWWNFKENMKIHILIIKNVLSFYKFKIFSKCWEILERLRNFLNKFVQNFSYFSETQKYSGMHLEIEKLVKIYKDYEEIFGKLRKDFREIFKKLKLS